MQYKVFSIVGLHAALAVGCALLAGCSSKVPTAQSTPATSSSQPEPAQMPAGAAGDEIRLGKLVFDETPRYAAAYVGNRLSCNDCHLKSGTAAHAAPMVNLANLFPMYNKRAGRVISLQERLQECFVRSENGRPLPDDSKEMRALVAYINWLSKDGVKGKPFEGRGLVKLPALKGDPARGKAVYASQCAACHGSDGIGEPPIIPPLWGRNSFNDGAGMNEPEKMAAFLMPNMPQNHPGTLAPQSAFDVAAFIHTMPRPKFNQAYRRY